MRGSEISPERASPTRQQARESCTDSLFFLFFSPPPPLHLLVPPTFSIRFYKCRSIPPLFCFSPKRQFPSFKVGLVVCVFTSLRMGKTKLCYFEAPFILLTTVAYTKDGGKEKEKTLSDTCTVLKKGRSENTSPEGKRLLFTTYRTGNASLIFAIKTGEGG